MHRLAPGNLCKIITIRCTLTHYKQHMNSTNQLEVAWLKYLHLPQADHSHADTSEPTLLQLKRLQEKHQDACIDNRHDLNTQKEHFEAVQALQVLLELHQPLSPQAIETQKALADQTRKNLLHNWSLLEIEYDPTLFSTPTFSGSAKQQTALRNIWNFMRRCQVALHRDNNEPRCSVNFEFAQRARQIYQTAYPYQPTHINFVQKNQSYTHSFDPRTQHSEVQSPHWTKLWEGTKNPSAVKALKRKINATGLTRG